MFNSKLAFGIVALSLSVTPALAQDFYGSVGLSYQLNDLTNGVGNPAVGNPTQEPLHFNQTQVDLLVGARFNNGYYTQFELSALDTDVLSNTDDALHDAATVALRGGRDFGKFQLGAFLGYTDLTLDDNVGDDKVYRTFGGFEGRYDFSPKVSAFGELGHIGAPQGGNHNGGVGPGGNDSIHNATYVIAGANYHVSPKLSLEGSLGYADGSMDNNHHAVYIKSVGLGVAYDFNVPGLTGYARANYSDYYETAENEGLYVKTLQLGLTYQFGAKQSASKRLRPLAPIVDWLGYTGGHME